MARNGSAGGLQPRFHGFSSSHTMLALSFIKCYCQVSKYKRWPIPRLSLKATTVSSAISSQVSFCYPCP